MVDTVSLINNLWVIIAALLVFIMTIAVGFLEVGELGEGFSRSLFKTVLITGMALFMMAFVGFNIAFAPTVLGGLIGNPLYNGLFLGGFAGSTPGLLTGTWWSMGLQYFNTGLTTGTYFFFETAFAAVTLALVSVIVLKKMRLKAFALYSVVYFSIIWTLPAAWIWNPTGWLYAMGMRDFAGGLVVHAAAGAAGLGILYQVWREERHRGHRSSPKVKINISHGWLALGILLLWIGWFGFNPGSVLAFNGSAITVVLTTFLASAAAMVTTILFTYIDTGGQVNMLHAVNGVLMGLIVITPLAGFVSPASAVILGLIAGPLFVYASKWFEARKWYTDPIGLFPGHLLGGIFGVLMIAFFTQSTFASASGTQLPNGLLFGGGMAALRQLGIEAFGIIVVMAVVFALSYLTCAVLAWAMGGITRKG
ncbi:MAG: ammonium transporter [Candidatus Marsarchaeota archaeon]|nr:ammonium transporter [Candidatus Marsarchaeota archaeon]